MDKKLTNRGDGITTCLICAREKALERGVCGAHYRAIRRKYNETLKERGLDAAEAGIQKLINDGLLLPSKQAGRKSEIVSIDEYFDGPKSRKSAIKKAQAKQATDQPRKEDSPTPKPKQAGGKK